MNFQAIHLYTISRGGFVLNDPSKNTLFRTSAYVIAGELIKPVDVGVGRWPYIIGAKAIYSCVLKAQVVWERVQATWGESYHTPTKLKKLCIFRILKKHTMASREAWDTEVTPISSC